MKISIITVCFNCEKCIEKTILSVINQNRYLIEYIIVDGSSTDNTINIIKKYKSQIDVIISEPDKGIYDGMNKGIQAASGDFIFFLNADDSFYNYNTIENVITFIKNDKVTSDAYYGNIEIENEYGIFIQIPRSIEKLKERMVISHQAIFIKSNILKDNLFDINYKYTADFKQLSSLYLKGNKFKYINLTISHTPLNSGATYDNYIASTKEHFRILKERGNNVFWREKKTLFIRKIIRSLKAYVPKCILYPILRAISKYKII